MPNRFFSQAMEGNDGENGGRPSERTINRYIELAKGGWGAVQIEAVSVTETSMARINGMILNRKNLDGMKKLAENFRKYNDKGLLLLQLTHSGERSLALTSARACESEGNSPPARRGFSSEKVTLTPPYSGRWTGVSQNSGSRYISGDEIERIKDLFIEGGLLAEEAGMDGIDLKMCHGYFCGEMLRPSNTRDDKWGGSFENRTRFLREVIGGIKSGLHSNGFLLGSRVSVYEGIRGGCGTAGPDEITEDISEMLNVVRVMDEEGMDFVNVSAGIPAQTGTITRPVDASKYLVLNHLRYAKAVKDLVERENLGLKVIGSAYSTFKDEAPVIMEEMLLKNNVDACGFGRQSFADPLTPKKLFCGEKVSWCILCSGCAKLMTAQKNDGCIIYNDYYREVNKSL